MWILQTASIKQYNAYSHLPLINTEKKEQKEILAYRFGKENL